MSDTIQTIIQIIEITAAKYVPGTFHDPPDEVEFYECTRHVDDAEMFIDRMLEIGVDEMTVHVELGDGTIVTLTDLHEAATIGTLDEEVRRARK